LRSFSHPRSTHRRYCADFQRRPRVFALLCRSRGGSNAAAGSGDLVWPVDGRFC
jgi:hypothetical protein